MQAVFALRAQGRGIRHIACRLERAPSTISREVRRNAATRSGGLDYRATTAHNAKPCNCIIGPSKIYRDFEVNTVNLTKPFNLLPRCGHLSTMEEPEAVTGLIADWLARP